VRNIRGKGFRTHEGESKLTFFRVDFFVMVFQMDIVAKLGGLEKVPNDGFVEGDHGYDSGYGINL
jgi:hypothetical protein